MLGPRPACWVAALCLAASVVVAAAPAHADPDDDLRAARQRANQAAAEFSAAQTASAKADDRVANAQLRVSRLQAKVAATQDQVRQLAMRLYVQGVAPINRMLRMADSTQLVPAQAYSHALAAQSDDALGRYRADREDLDSEVRTLQADQKQAAAAVQSVRQRQNEVSAEIDRLTKVVEAANAAKEAARKAEAAAAAARSSASSSSGGAASSPSGSGAAGTRPPAGSAAAAPAPTVPAPAPAVMGSGDWICPVQGPLAFSNDYGAARWGGGTHMGNDILAARGTPVVASVSGWVSHKTGSVSGLSYTLEGDDGNQYFGAHLDSYGANGQVSAGTVVGSVGNTGDAAGGPTHLHFEIHPGGWGSYVNPYPTLVRYC